MPTADPFEFVKEIPGQKHKKPRQLKKHKHYRVTVTYKDGDKFVRVYTDLAKAKKYALRARKSPVVRHTKVKLIS